MPTIPVLARQTQVVADPEHEAGREGGIVALGIVAFETLPQMRRPPTTRCRYPSSPQASLLSLVVTAFSKTLPLPLNPLHENAAKRWQ